MFRSAFRLPFCLFGIPVHFDVSFFIIWPLLSWVIGTNIGLYVELFDLPVGSRAFAARFHALGAGPDGGSRSLRKRGRSRAGPLRGGHALRDEDSKDHLVDLGWNGGVRGDAAAPEAWEAFQKMSSNDFDRLLVFDSNHYLIGVVTKTDLIRAIQIRIATTA